MSQLCPCGSAVEYSLCCYRYVSGAQVAPTPSHLMRSRYCAFVMKDADYLIKTGTPTVMPLHFAMRLAQDLPIPNGLDLPF